MAKTPHSSNSPPAADGALPFEGPLVHLEKQIQELETLQNAKGVDYSTEIRDLRTNWLALMKKTYGHLSAWETVLLARHPRRPLIRNFMDMMVKDFHELHGDRRFQDDRAIVTGLGHIGGQRVMVVGNDKGRETKDKIACHFGCAHPEGYRKALLKMKMAEKFGLPIVCLIDTPGAYPGIGAEERGIAQAIAENLLEMARLRTPIVCVVIGEGGSGGALGIGVGDRIGILQFAYYSVISPEGCAAILWRDGNKRSEAAEAMKLTAPQLSKLGIVDEIIPEPLGGAHRNARQAAMNLEYFITRSIRSLRRLPIEKLLDSRYDKLRRL